MPEAFAPANVEELRDILRDCGGRQTTLETGGSFSKRLAGGPIAATERRLTTSRLDQVLAYEPADLTISVGAGMRYSELSQVLARSNQMLPLDPPFSEHATVGGILATNSSGHRRRRYGTARDMLIGMRFATLEGRLVSSGGMVVKNVTGLDMGKLMIGSFGTLAVIASANFKVFPKPESSVSLQLHAPSQAALHGALRQVLGSVLQPNAVDWLDARAAASVGLASRHTLLVETSGTRTVTRRYRDAYGTLARRAGVTIEEVPQAVWSPVQECGPRWLEAHPGGAVVRVSTVHANLEKVVRLSLNAGCALRLRAGNAAGIVMSPDLDATSHALKALRAAGIVATLEASSDSVKQAVTQWDTSRAEGAVDIMRRIKADFDPLNLLNRGRLYGVI